jgi:uncharacterized membrane protein
MKLLALRLLFVALYLAVDVTYVLASFTTYDAAVRRVQGAGMRSAKPMLLPAAIFAYISLALGWWLLVAPAIEGGSVARGAAYGLVYALAVYGVFNATLYVMFRGWGAGIAARDLAWGVTCLSVLSASYAWACAHWAPR